MRYDDLSFFISPVTGKIGSVGYLPDAKPGTVFMAGKDGKPIASTALTEMRLDMILLRSRLTAVEAASSDSRRKLGAITGTVASVGLNVGAGLTVTGSPITYIGEFNLSLAPGLVRLSTLTDAAATDLINFRTFANNAANNALTTAKAYTDAKTFPIPDVINRSAAQTFAYTSALIRDNFLLENAVANSQTTVTLAMRAKNTAASTEIMYRGIVSGAPVSGLGYLQGYNFEYVSGSTRTPVWGHDGTTQKFMFYCPVDLLGNSLKTTFIPSADNDVVNLKYLKSYAFTLSDVVTKTNTQSFAYTNTTQKDSFFLDNVMAGSPSSVTLAMRARNTINSTEAIYRHVVSTAAQPNTNYVSGYTFEYGTTTAKTRVWAHDAAAQKMMFYTPADFGGNGIQTSFTPSADNDVVNVKYLKSYTFSLPNPMTVSGLVIQNNEAVHSLTLRNQQLGETWLNLDDSRNVSFIRAATSLSAANSSFSFGQRTKAANGTLGAPTYFISMGSDTGVSVLQNISIDKNLLVKGETTFNDDTKFQGILDISTASLWTEKPEMTHIFSSAQTAPIATFRSGSTDCTAIGHRIQGWLNGTGGSNQWNLTYRFGKQDAAKRVCGMIWSHYHYKLGSVQLLDLTSNIDGNEMHWNFSANSFKFCKIGDSQTFFYITTDSQYLLHTGDKNMSVYKPASASTASAIIGIPQKFKTIPNGKTAKANGASHIVFNEFYMQFVTNTSILGFIFTNYAAQNAANSYIAYIDSGGNYYKNSDASVKFSMRSKKPEGYLERLKSLNVYSYAMRNQISESDDLRTRDQKYFDNRTLQIGFMASDVLRLFDNLTDKTKLLTISEENAAEFNALTLGHKPSMTDEEYIASQNSIRPITSVDYQSMTCYLLLGVQELAAQVEALSKKIELAEKMIAS